MLLKGWTSQMSEIWDIPKAHRVRGSLIDCILKMLVYDWTASEAIELTKSALRFYLFEDLGLRHVCCRIADRDLRDQILLPPVEAEEARELQEEDEERTQKFHDLLPKAELEYQQASGSFSEFWSKFYQDNIASSQENESPEVFAQSMIEIGVRIHEID
ncbi:MAG: hypothetical protein LQ338_003103 [Usnochroma carphineum]|nr:MAG: hypothetical protein LQ338_003103 [Usnochroma carphineum]